MADLTSTTAAAVGAGVGAAALNAIGLEPSQLLPSFFACLVGAGFAPEMGRLRAGLVFVSAVVCSAVVGKFAALRWLDASVLSSALCTIAVGLFFHPMTAALLKVIPQLRDRALGTKEEPK